MTDGLPKRFLTTKDLACEGGSWFIVSPVRIIPKAVVTVNETGKATSVYVEERTWSPVVSYPTNNDEKAT